VRSAARLAAAAGCLILAACGGQPAMPAAQSSRPDQVTVTPGPDGVQVVDIDADDGFRFHPSVVQARPGVLQVTLHHVGTGAPHNWVARQPSAAQVPLVRAGESRSVRFRIAQPGDYRFVCTIHEAQGMAGRLVVRAAS